MDINEIIQLLIDSVEILLQHVDMEFIHLLVNSILTRGEAVVSQCVSGLTKPLFSFFCFGHTIYIGES